MKQVRQIIWAVLTSVQLSVGLLVLALILVFLATLQQTYWGVYIVQKEYFGSFWVLWKYADHWPYAYWLRHIRFLLPGGYLIGMLLLANLLCAHFRYFKHPWRHLGIASLHGGVVLLLVSGFLTSGLQQESQMVLAPEQTTYYAENHRANELAVVDITDSQMDENWILPEQGLKKGASIEVLGTPFTVEILQYFPNAALGFFSEIPNLGTAGVAQKTGLVAVSQPLKRGDDAVNTAAIYARFLSQSGEDLGVWLLSNVIDDRYPAQILEYNGRRYALSLRFERIYFPFGLYLKTFKREYYPGTETPSAFSSLVEIRHIHHKEPDRQALIYMNNPLRYGAFTFYQSGFEASTGKSILQVVYNPIKYLPYIALGFIAFGLVFHFVRKLLRAI